MTMAPEDVLLTRQPETYRFYLQNCQCRLICLALCHDNGYIAELDKYRNDTTAKQKTWLVDHHAKGRGFLDPPFHMVKFDEIFSTKALYVKRITASSSLTNKSSSYSSAMTNSFSVEQAPRSEQSPFFMLDRQPRYAHGAESPSGTQSEPQQNLTPGPRTPFFAPELATPAVGDQVIPVVRTLTHHHHSNEVHIYLANYLTHIPSYTNHTNTISPPRI